MPVRSGLIDDLPGCKAIAYYCFMELETYRDLTPEFELLTERLLTDSSYALFVSEKEDGSINGFMVAQLQRGLYFRETVATNLVFYVLPEARGMAPYLLIKEFEAWAKLNKANEVHLSTSGGTNLERNLKFFSGLGYKLSGILTIKKVK